MAWPFGKSKAAEQRSRAVASYIRSAVAEPDDEDVRWLATVTGDGDTDRARWELRYARRSFALLVAERDALDDRTGSLVAREMRQALQMDRSVAAGMVAVAERQFNQRLVAFRTALTDRSSPDSPDDRIARVLLDRVGVREVTVNLPKAAGIVRRYMDESQNSLRSAFGIASVPEDVPPSVWDSKQSR